MGSCKETAKRKKIKIVHNSVQNRIEEDKKVTTGKVILQIKLSSLKVVTGTDFS